MLQLFLIPGIDWTRLLALVEEFAGQHEVTKAQWDLGNNAVPLLSLQAGPFIRS